jgi:hypothetical protein
MGDYRIQIQRLMFVSNGTSIKKLNIYDIDGTLIPFSRRGKSIQQGLIRCPEEPFVLLSARASANKSFTRAWCDFNNLRPLAIFHRDISQWSFEQGNINFYKPYILTQIRKVLPDIELIVFDDENINLSVSAEICFKRVHRTMAALRQTVSGTVEETLRHTGAIYSDSRF